MIKKIVSALLALSMCLAISGCGSSDDSADASSNYKSKVEVPTADTVANIPDTAQKELVYLSDGDLNPTAENPEKSTELTLFEEKGGSIKWNQCNYNDKYDKLASAIASGKDVPDIFKHEWLAFPSQIVKDMYQPVDEIVDFESDMWSGIKESADQYQLGGKHYIAPLYNRASMYLYYDGNIVDKEGLDDPMELYEAGEWDWDAMHDVMSKFVSGASGDEQRYGLNGFYTHAFVQQTGKTLVSYDTKTSTFKNNVGDPDIERAENTLYNWDKEGLILGGWIGSAKDAFNAGCLFYGMGLWAATGVNGVEGMGVVPIPADPNNKDAKITTPEMVAYMWVNGSTAKEAVKCWYECNRVAYTDPTFVKVTKDKFLTSNPEWTEQMYDITQSVLADDYKMIFDYGYGVSSILGDANAFDGDRTLVDATYQRLFNKDDLTKPHTWSQIKGKYNSVYNAEVDAINKAVKQYISK